LITYGNTHLTEETVVSLPIMTARLVIRRFTVDDAGDILVFSSQSSVNRVVSGNITATEDGVRAYIATQNSYVPFEKDKIFDLALERKEDGRVMGLLTLICRDHRQGTIGWALGEEHRGRGYATEGARALMAYGFRVLGLHRIQAETTNSNPDSLAVMERLGMKREARLRETVFENGRWHDTLIYGMLAGEWRDPAAGG
jgi:RimJ/RimL family protein N-acetyltransferase